MNAPLHLPTHKVSATTIGPATSSLFSLPPNTSTIVNANNIAVPGLKHISNLSLSRHKPPLTLAK